MISITSILIICSIYSATPISSSNLGSPQGALEVAKPLFGNLMSTKGPLSKVSLSGLNSDDINPTSKLTNAIALAALKQRRSVHLDSPAANGKPGPIVRFKQADDVRQRRDWYGNDYFNGY